MSRIEELVALFLERREAEPELEAGAFSAEYPECATELVAAIEKTLKVVGLFAQVPPLVGSTGGRRIGDYTVLREVGRGGMGVVFEVRRTDDPEGESLALKILPMAGLLGPRAMQRFEREARALARLDHGQIVAARDFGLHEDTPYLVMDLVQGPALGELVGSLGAREGAQLLRSLAQAVESAHQVGILHRDLKPQNVRLRSDGEPVLLDFGLVADADEASLTSTGDLLGTPRYMAPEQARGRPATPRTDVYALGVILYELATGRPAFPQDSRAGVLRAVTNSRYAPPSRLNPKLPKALDRIVRVAMAWNPARRYPTASDMAQDLERFLKGEPVRARPPSIVTRSTETLRRRPAASAAALLGLFSTVILVFGVLVPHLRSQEAELQRQVDRRFDRAVASWILGKSEDVDERLGELLELDPDHSEGLALLSLQAGVFPKSRTPPALKSLVEGLELEQSRDFPAARERYQSAFESDRRSPWIAVLLARSARRMGRLELAEADLVEASQRLPDSVAVAQELARALCDRERYVESEREYRRAIELDGSDPILWRGLAIALFCQEKNEEALEVTQKCMELTGGPSIANTMAALLDRQGEHEQALEILRRLVQQHPESAGYVYNMAYCLDSQDRIAEAKPLYERVLELDRDNVNATVCLSWLLATAEVEELRDEQAAEELILSALERDRGHSPGLIKGAKQVAVETGRIERIAELMGRLAEEGEVDARTVRLERARRALLATDSEGRASEEQE